MDEFLSTLKETELQKILSVHGQQTKFQEISELVQRVKQCLTEEDSIQSITEILLYEEENSKHENFNEEKTKEEDDDDEVYQDSQEGEMATNFTFRDVDDALEKFSGESETSVEKWLASYEEVATNCKWNDSQKYLFARKLLIGAAKSAVEGDRAVVTYDLLKAKLNGD